MPRNVDGNELNDFNEAQFASAMKNASFARSASRDAELGSYRIRRSGAAEHRALQSGGESRNSNLNLDRLLEGIYSLQANRQQALNDVRFFNRVLVTSTAIAASGLSVGSAIWILRGSALAASLFSTLPAWMSLDPLPILDTYESKSAKKQKDDSPSDTVEGIISS